MCALSFAAALVLYGVAAFDIVSGKEFETGNHKLRAIGEVYVCNNLTFKVERHKILDVILGRYARAVQHPPPALLLQANDGISSPKTQTKVCCL